ncbi:MAG TPA: DUF3093 domain-containing protein [Streptosporangiaceae bacterium]|nr:DUF3093 domain-containing protein [Streptosporangiaceae bacterium]
MSGYHERLRVPALWWAIAIGCVLVLGTELFAGFSLTVGVVIYVVIAAACGTTLLHWGGAVVEVSESELRAGPARLPLDRAGEVRPLDEAQTRAMRGPGADPAAYLLVRPYLKESVYVEVRGADARWPYLLIGTRRPQALASAIEGSRTPLAGEKIKLARIEEEH